jgi:exopolyphosphatase/guanosine-5'-triphosphate,3'-diphosphate pyrophosphatase
MTIGVIDIGTNTVLLLIAQLDDGGAIETLAYEQRIPRLGKGVDSARNLTPDSMQRVVDVLREYRTLLEAHAVEKVIVAGTSAVRDAHNRTELAALIAQATGFDLEVLSGDDEAYWTYRGAISGTTISHATVIDIGGGSTEVSVGDARTVSHMLSHDVGSVRVTERFLRHDPPLPQELAEARAFVRQELTRSASFPFKHTILVGVAGTASSLAILDRGLREFSVRAIMNYRLSLPNVQKLFDTLSTRTAGQILELSPVMQGRSDIVTAGALILLEFMTHNSFGEMIVSERGVRYGLAIREWEKAHPAQPGAQT